MKSRKNQNREQRIDLNDQTDNKIQHRKKKNVKVKYRHQNHWLEEVEFYEFLKYKGEEE